MAEAAVTELGTVMPEVATPQSPATMLVQLPSLTLTTALAKEPAAGAAVLCTTKVPGPTTPALPSAATAVKRATRPRWLAWAWPAAVALQ